MFVWDDNKRQRNLDKHGVDLAAFERMDFETALVIRDDRFDYEEERDLIYGLIDDRLYAAVVTYRDDTVRVISLRKANARERKVFDAR